MDRREAIKSMINNLINDKNEEASLDIHNVLVAKMRDVAGLSSIEVDAADDVPAGEDDVVADDDSTGKDPVDAVETVDDSSAAE